MLLKIFLFSCLALSVLATDDSSILSDEYIKYLNDQNLSWKAGRNFAEDTPIEHIRSLLGSLDYLEKRDSSRKTLIKQHNHLNNSMIPKEFDSRVKWSSCQSIKTIRDQGSCGSCWAFGTVEAISDRICIASGQKEQVEISAETLLTCCGDDCGDGCFGGYTSAAYRYWINNGLPSGGLYADTKTCQPYTIPPCEHHVNGPRPKCTEAKTTPDCKRTCQKSFNKSFTNDLHYGSSYSQFQLVEEIQKEIMTNGPVTASFMVYADFPNYKSGVYQRHSDKILGGHCIKIIGWGVENHLPYWLVANSWNTDWGENGFFKILRGQDECGIEDSVYGGVPKLN